MAWTNRTVGGSPQPLLNGRGAQADSMTVSTVRAKTPPDQRQCAFRPPCDAR